MDTTTIVLVTVLTFVILAIFSIVSATYFEVQKIRNTPNIPLEPKTKFLATKSGKVYVGTLKRSVIYNDDEKLYRKELEKRGNEDGSRGD